MSSKKAAKVGRLIEKKLGKALKRLNQARALYKDAVLLTKCSTSWILAGRAIVLIDTAHDEVHKTRTEVIESLDKLRTSEIVKVSKTPEVLLG